MRKSFLFLIIIFGLIFPIFSFAQINSELIKQKVPGILEDWWNSIKTFFGKTKDIFWGALIKAWQGALSLWGKMWLWVKNTWESYLSSRLDLLSEKIKAKFR